MSTNREPRDFWLIDGLVPVPVELTVAHAAPLDMEAVAVDFVERVTAMLGAERSALFLLEESSGDLVTRHAQGARIPIRIARGQGIVGWVAQHRRPVRVADAYADPRFVRAWDQASGKRTRALIAAPLENPAGDLVGVIASANKRGGFDALDEGALTSIAALAAVRLDHSRVLQKIESRNREITSPIPTAGAASIDLQFLQDLDELLADTHDARSAVALVLARLRETFALPAAVGLVTGREPVFVIDRGDDSTARRVNAAQASATVSHLETNPSEVPGLLGHDTPLGTWILRAPIEARGEVSGILELYVLRDHPSPPEPRLAALTANHLGRVLEALDERSAPTRGDRLTQVAQSIGTFVHDLRLPLSAAVGYADLLADEEDPAERTYFVRMIRAALREIDEMANDILDFVKGNTSIQVEAMELSVFLESVLGRLEPDLGRYDASIELAGDRTGRIWVDAGLLRRALTNLAMNAIQAGATEVSITARCTPSALTLWVKDNGNGIPLDIQDRLFEPFVTSGKRGGTGLGLASARRAVESHGGRIELVETGEAGTVFELTLPSEPTLETRVQNRPN